MWTNRDITVDTEDHVHVDDCIVTLCNEAGLAIYDLRIQGFIRLTYMSWDSPEDMRVYLRRLGEQCGTTI